MGGSADTDIRESSTDFLIVLLSIMRIDILLRVSMLKFEFQALKLDPNISICQGTSV